MSDTEWSFKKQFLVYWYDWLTHQILQVPLGLFSLFLPNISVHIGDLELNSFLNVSNFFPRDAASHHCFRKSNTATSNSWIKTSAVISNLSCHKGQILCSVPKSSGPRLPSWSKALPCSTVHIPPVPPGLLTVTPTARGQIPFPGLCPGPLSTESLCWRPPAFQEQLLDLSC